MLSLTEFKLRRSFLYAYDSFISISVSTQQDPNEMDVDVIIWSHATWQNFHPDL